MVIAYTLLSEILGLMVRDLKDVQIVYKKNYYEYNTAIFNIFDIIYNLYFLYIYRNTINTPVSRKIIDYGSVLFLITCVVNLFIQDFLTEPQNVAIIIGSVFLVYAALTYLLTTIKKDYKIPHTSNLLFWISIGILLFYSIYPINMYILGFEYNFFISHNLSVYHLITIGVLYTCYIIGFLLMKRFRKFT
ncbi:hypothetical protein ACNR9Q_07875 [Maribacter sp. X9]|uniref:hypothetical protein n=1 Tax=Maribacter sp. X9 TaxID=3402159 RepID=UPI003AF3C5C3